MPAGSGQNPAQQGYSRDKQVEVGERAHNSRAMHDAMLASCMNTLDAAVSLLLSTPASAGQYPTDWLGCVCVCMQHETCASTAAFVLLQRTCGRWCDLRLGLALCCACPMSSSLSSSSGPMSSRSYRAMRAVMWLDLLLLMGPPLPRRACQRQHK
jgi:hypothetical protein